MIVHPLAINDSRNVGEGTRIWAFSHVLPGAVVGSDCNICEHVFIENNVVIGDRVTIKSGVQLWNGVRIGDDVFVGPNATFTNDMHPRSKQYKDPELTVVEDGASIGANATILPGVTIGAGAMVGAGAVVVRSVLPGDTVIGNPASPIVKTSTSPPGGCSHRIVLTTAIDHRGSLAALEFDHLPFAPKRMFVVHGVPQGQDRGGHAHRACHQLLICASGSLICEVECSRGSGAYDLSAPGTALYLPPMHWARQTRFSRDASLVVLASHPYDADDYIRDYAQFKEESG